MDRKQEWGLLAYTARLLWAGRVLFFRIPWESDELYHKSVRQVWEHWWEHSRPIPDNEIEDIDDGYFVNYDE